MTKTLKIALIGMPATGKSSLLLKVQQRELDEVYNPTMASDMVLKEFTVKKDDAPITYAVQFWEICNMTSVGRSFLRGIHGLVLVVDLTSAESLESIDALYTRVKILANFTNDAFPCILVGNKADATTEEKVLKIEDLLQSARRLRPEDPDSIRCFETSAKTGQNVEEMFIHIFEKVLITPTTVGSPASSTYSTPMRTSPFTSPLTFGAYRTPYANSTVTQTPFSRTGDQASTTFYTTVTESEVNDESGVDEQRSGRGSQSGADDEETYLEGSTIIEPSEVGIPESKVIFCGAPCVGKSSILDRYLDNSPMIDEYTPTNGMDFRRAQLTIKDQMVFLNIWDIAGNPQYLEQSKNMFRDADCLVLVYDITSDESFDALDLYWDFFMEHAMPSDPDEFPVLLIGNKSDLSDRRAVTLEEVLDWCTTKRPRKPITYIECSASMKIGLSDAFVYIGDTIYDYAQRESSVDEDEMESEAQRQQDGGASQVGNDEDEQGMHHHHDGHNIPGVDHHNHHHDLSGQRDDSQHEHHRGDPRLRGRLRDPSITSTPTAARNPESEKSCWFDVKSCLAFRIL